MYIPQSFLGLIVGFVLGIIFITWLANHISNKK